jgi:hypothetical protein
MRQYLPWEGLLVGGYILNPTVSGLLKIRGDSDSDFNLFPAKMKFLYFAGNTGLGRHAGTHRNLMGPSPQVAVKR